MDLPDPYPLRAEHAAAAGALIAAAFARSAAPRFVMPDPARRTRLLPGHFRALTLATLHLGEAVAIGDPLHGVALWWRPGFEVAAADALAAAGMAGELAIYDDGERARLDALDTCLEDLHARAVAGPHWYLPFLAVDPARQGAGLGSALVRWGIAQAGGIPCVLETVDAANLAFYRRLGFRVAVTGTVAGGGPPAWALVHDGAPAG